MPFTATPTRSRADLTEFFATNLKNRIESDRTLANEYIVRRSDDVFNITEQIIRDLYDADIVLCDLSGYFANPNVMYELGVRLAVSDKPVILFREAATENRRIFDIQGFYAFEYSPTRYRELEDYIIAKIRKFESGDEAYESPVQRVIRGLPSVVDRLKRDYVMAMLELVADSMQSAVIAFELNVDRVLKDAGISLEPDDSITEHLVCNASRFRALPWDTVRIRPRAVPALHAFLSQPVLQGLLPPGHVAAVTSRITDYYAEYFADEAVWDELRFTTLRAFLGETEAIHAAFRFLSAYLERGDESKLKWALNLFGSPVEKLEWLYMSTGERIIFDSWYGRVPTA